MERGFQFILILFVIFMGQSCHKCLYDFDYKGEANYKSSYIVDTISILDPIIVDYDGGRFVFSKELLDSIKIDKSFINRPDVFILGFNFYSDLDTKDYLKFKYENDGRCSMKRLPLLKKQNVEFLEYVETPRFILQLVNVNHYNKTHNSSHKYYAVKSDQPKNSYYKVVFPLCN